MKHTIRKTGSFLAKRGDTGETVTIYVYTKYVDTSSCDGRSEAACSRLLRLSDGAHVNRIDAGHYRTVFPEVDLFTDDQTAP